MNKPLQPFTRAFALLLLLSCGASPACELDAGRMLAQADDDDHLRLYQSGYRIKTFAMSGKP